MCYCDDCQIYALHLGRPDVLDERGGTDACMLAPKQVTITQGAEQIRCVRLSPKGLYRWYAGCCNTPLGNTLGPRLPVLILVHSCIEQRADARSREQDLGPPAVRMMGRFARGGVPEGAAAKMPVGMLPKLLGHLARGFFGGRAQPSPFFDGARRPRVQPALIDKAEREALRARVHAAAGL
ncbi:MAG: hypothetical protein JWN48_1062 [Myxococcaceae bacterium]|nr:hypothetical protein [Myxococcaceae bacterium]